MSEFFNNDNSPFKDQYPDGHPVRVYLEENILIRSTIRELQATSIETQLDFYSELFNKLGKVELHFARKENQLFPYLEKHGWTSPSQNMWAFHDQIRDEIKQARKAIKEGDVTSIIYATQSVFNSLEHIMQIEEQRLFP
ncbi:MAG: hemerythrin domain-containing protein, partial [Campylobacterota bacterium]|nr:hemerythrin domain-containing protein [Campylobacterota bacterium]